MTARSRGDTLDSRVGPSGPPEPSADSILYDVRVLRPSLSHSEALVADVVLGSPSQVAQSSITELADRAGTSETTVTRFCRSVGLRGFRQLRLVLYAASDRLGDMGTQAEGLAGDVESDDSAADIVAKVAFGESQAVQETAKRLDVATLEAVMEAVIRANRVDVFAVGATGVVAEDLQGKLHHIGLRCSYWPDIHRALISAAQLTDGDVAIAISQTGQTREPVEMLQLAKRYGATTVALTADPRPPSPRLRTTSSQA